MHPPLPCPTPPQLGRAPHLLVVEQQVTWVQPRHQARVRGQRIQRHTQQIEQPVCGEGGRGEKGEYGRQVSSWRFNDVMGAGQHWTQADSK
jgi:hypothetical protein